MLALARLLVRSVLAVVVFVVACPVLALVSLAAMYSDRRIAFFQPLK